MRGLVTFFLGGTFRFNGADVLATGLKKDSSLVT